MEGIKNPKEHLDFKISLSHHIWNIKGGTLSDIYLYEE